MAKKTKSQLKTEKREEIIARVARFLTDEGEEVLRESGNALAWPTTDAEGNEIFAKLVISIPTGSRLDGEAYDGYAAAQDYQIHLEEKQARKEQKEREKALEAKKRAEKQEAHRLKKEAEERKKAEANKTEEKQE